MTTEAFTKYFDYKQLESHHFPARFIILLMKVTVYLTKKWQSCLVSYKNLYSSLYSALVKVSHAERKMRLQCNEVLLGQGFSSFPVYQSLQGRDKKSESKVRFYPSEASFFHLYGHSRCRWTLDQNILFFSLLRRGTTLNLLGAVMTLGIGIGYVWYAW